MNTAFVLAPETGLPLFWDLIAPVRQAGDRVEFWLPGPVPKAPSPAFDSLCCPAPDLVIYGAAEGGVHANGRGPEDIRWHESLLHWLEGLYAAQRPDLIIFPGTLTGHELGTRLAARIKGGCFPETRSLLREGNRLFARKKVCGSNLDWDAGITEYPAVLTVTGKTTAQNSGEGGVPRLESRPVEPLTPPRWILAYEQSESFPSRPLETAPLIFAAGR
ncbi:MAG: hypothetical protein LBI94_02230, partial [Treponema sp.]|nr:hypothetical protein [Treponema sp.]